MNNDFLGIDLGTTNSCVGVWKNGQVCIVPNEQGDAVTPSCVLYSAENGPKVGVDAKEMLQMNDSINSKNIVFDTKRMLGKKLNDQSIQALVKQWPFEVVANPAAGGKPLLIRVLANGGKAKLVEPEEVSALVLKKMMQIGAKPLGNQDEVRRAVLAYPANFDAAQRQATMDCAKRAGLEVIRMITEPTAAAMAYGFYHGNYDGYNILVYDFGGGTFDVTIIKANKGEFEQLVTRGDATFGGRDLDAALCELCYAKIVPKFPNILDHRKKKVQTHLANECTLLKERLTVEESVGLQIPFLNDFDVEVTRAEFEQCCQARLQKTMEITLAAVAQANLRKEDINICLLVGGSTLVPRVRQMLVEQFGERVIDQKIDPATAVAYGCTVVAAQETGAMQTPKLSLVEILSLSIGIELADGRMCKLMERGCKMPCKVTETFSTSENDQAGMTFEIYQGESPLAKQNVHIGTLKWGDKDDTAAATILLGPAQHSAVQLEMCLDRNGLLRVRAWHGRRVAEAEIGQTKLVTGGNAQRMVEKSRKSAPVEKAENDRLAARTELDLALKALNYSLKKVNTKNEAANEQQHQLRALYAQTYAWLQHYQRAEKQRFVEKLDMLKRKQKQIEEAQKQQKKEAKKKEKEEEKVDNNSSTWNSQRRVTRSAAAVGAHK